MKKLTAAVCAVLIAMSMVGCGSGDLSSKKHNKDSKSSASAGTGDNSASDSKKSVMDVIAGGAAADDADIEINTDYEYKTLLGDGVNTDKAVAISAEFTKDSIKQTKKDATEARYGLNSESQMYGYLKALHKAAKK